MFGRCAHAEALLNRVAPGACSTLSSSLFLMAGWIPGNEALVRCMGLRVGEVQVAAVLHSRLPGRVFGIPGVARSIPLLGQGAGRCVCGAAPSPPFIDFKLQNEPISRMSKSYMRVDVPWGGRPTPPPVPTPCSTRATQVPQSLYTRYTRRMDDTPMRAQTYWRGSPRRPAQRVTDAEGAPPIPNPHSLTPQEPGASDDSALAASTASSGDNKLQGGGANAWSLESITNWEFWWPGFPVLVYYKENQTRAEGQPHFFPIIMVLLNMPEATVPLTFLSQCAALAAVWRAGVTTLVTFLRDGGVAAAVAFWWLGAPTHQQSRRKLGVCVGGGAPARGQQCEQPHTGWLVVVALAHGTCGTWWCWCECR